MTMGWFLKEKELAMMQTPHHFFSRTRLSATWDDSATPNEGTLFYGLVQDGNDMGRDLLLRLLRGDPPRPLDEIGGIAVETVTEDAHTSLRLHRRGHTSAYMRIRRRPVWRRRACRRILASASAGPAGWYKFSALITPCLAKG